MLKAITICSLALCLLCCGCKDGFLFGGKAKDPVVVKVGERHLFKSELDGLVHEGISKADSAAIVDGYIQNWIRESLMIAEAEKNVAADININKLIEDYRSSLLVYNYEKRLIDTKLDTIVPYNDKLKYYNMNKNQFMLSHPILKCIIAKIPSKVGGIGSVKKALEKKELTEAMFLIKEKASFHHIDTAKWMTVEDLISLVPAGMIDMDKIGKGKVYQKKDKDSEYFVKLLRFYDEKQIPPFEYIEDKINKIILSDRKIHLLKHVREDLYEKGLADKMIEIYKLDK